MQKDPFFIVGYSRSGTTLIARILSKHPDIHVLEETHFMREYGEIEKEIDLSDCNSVKDIAMSFQSIQYSGIYGRNLSNIDKNKIDYIVDEFYRKEQQTFEQLIRVLFECEAKEKGKPIAGDQTPNHIFYIDKLSSWFPKSKFIYMVRDPRAILLSQKNKWKAAKRWGQPSFEVLRARLNYHPITQQLYWNKAAKAGEKAKQQLGDNRFHIIKFEELVEEPKLIIKQLCEYLNVNFSSEMLFINVELSADAADEGKRGISKKVASRWQYKLTPSEAFISEKISNDYLRLLGYKSSNSIPNIFMLIFWVIIWPFHLIVAGLLNINRFRNYFRKAFISRS